MKENWSEQLMSVINQIAEKLGVAAEKVYPILRKQAMIDGILSLLGILTSVVTFFLIYKAVEYCYFKKDKNGNAISYRWDLTHFVFGTICVLLFIFSVVSITIDIRDVMTAFMNPDWYIINNILGQLIK